MFLLLSYVRARYPQAQERGPFAVVGRDVLQLIMSNLGGRDVVALAQVNSWYSSGP